MLVNSIIVLLEVNPLADTSVLENQIDFLVYHLYGLISLFLQFFLKSSILIERFQSSSHGSCAVSSFSKSSAFDHVRSSFSLLTNSSSL